MTNSGNGELLAIWAKGEPRMPMIPRQDGLLAEGEGLEGSAPAKGKRQVTVLSREGWRQAAQEAGIPDADPENRRANLLVTGVDLNESIGRTLAVGDTHIRIHGETRPCSRMSDVAPALLEALRPEWRGGAFGEVVRGGAISVGDRVRWVS